MAAEYRFEFYTHKDLPHHFIKTAPRPDQYLLCYKGDKLAGFAELFRKRTYCHYFIFVFTSNTLNAETLAKIWRVLILDEKEAKGIIAKLVARLEYFAVNNWKLKQFYCCTHASTPPNLIIPFLTRNRKVIKAKGSLSGMELVELARIITLSTGFRKIITKEDLRKAKEEFWDTIGAAAEGINYKL